MRGFDLVPGWLPDFEHGDSLPSGRAARLECACSDDQLRLRICGRPASRGEVWWSWSSEPDPPVILADLLGDMFEPLLSEDSFQRYRFEWGIDHQHLFVRS